MYALQHLALLRSGRARVAAEARPPTGGDGTRAPGAGDRTVSLVAELAASLDLAKAVLA